MSVVLLVIRSNSKTVSTVADLCKMYHPASVGGSTSASVGKDLPKKSHPLRQRKKTGPPIKMSFKKKVGYI